MEVLRKLVAIALLVVFGLPFAQSLLALTPKSDANLPACCRRNGKHHCMMSVAERNKRSSDEPQFAAPLEKCPYSPAAIMVGHHPTSLVAPQGEVVYTDFMSHPNGVAQTESKFRISRERSRHKRGPPALSL